MDSADEKNIIIMNEFGLMPFLGVTTQVSDPGQWPRSVTQVSDPDL